MIPGRRKAGTALACCKRAGIVYSRATPCGWPGVGAVVCGVGAGAVVCGVGMGAVVCSMGAGAVVCGVGARRLRSCRIF
ncbi:MAG TPA: hypothetical protein VKV40_03135 [Ktedonobacteraceae bacterium]|nr:hypothetical protein [Ktedonobacteraceae bacterium]